MRWPGWRGLAVFWTAILLAVAAGGAALQSLGPPAPRATLLGAAPSPPAASGAPTTPAPPPVPPAAKPAAATAAGLLPGRATPGPIDDPDPLLLEPAKAGNGAMLPRQDGTGRGPMQAYARGFDRTTLRPRIGLILAGIGANEAASQDAIRTLPGGITLAISPYTVQPPRLLDEARIAGHEYLLSLPLESIGDVGNDAGDHALLSGASAAQNAARLDWALSRFAGYAGVTNALGALRGDRFSAAPDRMDPLLHALAARGLFFIDTRPGAVLPQGVWGAAIDLVVDEPAVRSEIDARLAQLESLARQRGWALGLAQSPRPITIGRLADWANGLADKGFALAPASALVQMQPAAPADKKTGATVTGASK
jgi:polysaccharide deacetylase 2 family uncharacterized protein YibQ